MCLFIDRIPKQQNKDIHYYSKEDPARNLWIVLLKFSSVRSIITCNNGLTSMNANSQKISGNSMEFGNANWWGILWVVRNYEYFLLQFRFKEGRQIFFIFIQINVLIGPCYLVYPNDNVIISFLDWKKEKKIVLFFFSLKFVSLSKFRFKCKPHI